MKKQNNGFTLIEVLSVIAVLAIIFSIAVPKILDIVEKSRRRAFFSSATSIVNTVKTEYFQNLYHKNFGYKSYEFDKMYPSGYKQNSETLKLKGDLPSIGTVKLKENGKIALAVVSHDERYCAKKGYSDAEVTVEDYVFGKCNIEADGNIIGEEFKINITSTPKDFLEETKEGWSKSKEVTITHNADDRAKLQYQLGTTTGKWIDYDDKFKLEQNTTIYARLYTSTNSIESSLKVTTIDREGPSITISGNPTEWTNKDVTLTATANDEQSGLAIKKPAYNFDEETTWQASNIKKYSSNKEGIVIKVRDKAGNVTTYSPIAITKIDKIPPKCRSGGGSNAWTKESRTLLGKCTDGESGCKGDVSRLINWQVNWTNLSPGTVYDKVGNSRVCPANQTVRIDKTRPTIEWLKIIGEKGKVMTSQIDNNGSTEAYLYSSVNGITGTPPYVSYKSSDDGGSGVNTNTLTCSGNNIQVNGNQVHYTKNEGYSSVTCSVTTTDTAGNKTTSSLLKFKVGSGWMDIGSNNWKYYDSNSNQFLTGFQTLNWSKVIGSNGLITRFDNYYFSGNGLMLKGYIEVPRKGPRFFIPYQRKFFELPEGSMFNPSDYRVRGLTPFSTTYKNSRCFVIRYEEFWYKIDDDGTVSDKGKGSNYKYPQCPTIDANN